MSSKYEKLNLLGRGKFSFVHLARNLKTDELVAMKIIDKKYLSVKERDFLREEISIIRSISHPHAV